MEASSGKASYTKPTQPEVITSVDWALNSQTGGGSDASFNYVSL